MPREPKLDENALQTALATLPGWSLANGEITRTWKFTDFVASMAFVHLVADEAEAAQHHPDIDIRYNSVRLALVTHDSGGITRKDIEMAAALNRIPPSA